MNLESVNNNSIITLSTEEKKGKSDFFKKLPLEIWALILSFLPLQDLSCMRQVNKDMRNLIDYKPIYDKEDEGLIARMHRAYIKLNWVEENFKDTLAKISTLEKLWFNDTKKLKKTWFTDIADALQGLTKNLGLEVIRDGIELNMPESQQVECKIELHKLIKETKFRLEDDKAQVKSNYLKKLAEVKMGQHMKNVSRKVFEAKATKLA